MALFGSKKNSAPAKVEKAEAKKPAVVRAQKMPKAVKVAVPEKAPVPVKAARAAGTPHAPSRVDFAAALIGPRITEKASMVAEKGLAYVFNVRTDASKHAIAKAVKDLYNVLPVKVRTVSIPAKHVFSRGKAGVKQGGKKAYVYLKAGEKIEIV